MDNLLNDLNVVVKSFNRPECINKLVKSWNGKYPEVKLTIIDDSTNKIDFSGEIFKNHDIHILPQQDMGLSYGRNYGAQVTNKKYILFLDDDFVICEDTSIEKMLRLFSVDKNVGVVGGIMGKRSVKAVYQGGLLELSGSICKKIGQGDVFDAYEDIKYRFCSFNDNFFIADRRVFDNVSWDTELKVAEHIDFFLQLKNTDWRVIFTPESRVEHEQVNCGEDYNSFRFKRYGLFKEKMWQKYGITEDVYINDGRIQKRWITPSLRVDYTDNGEIVPVCKKLYNNMLVAPVENSNSGIKQADDVSCGCSGKIIALGLEMLSMNYHISNIVFFQTGVGKKIISSNGFEEKEYILLSADEISGAKTILSN